MNNNAIIIDGVLLAVLLFSAFKAYHDGFFTSVIKLVGNLGGFVAAWYVSGRYSRLIFEKYLREGFITKAYDYLSQTSRATDVKTALESLVGRWPQEFVNSILQKTRDSLSAMLSPDMESAVLLVDEFLAPMIISCISVILFIICFFAVRMICKVAAGSFRTINKVPLLGFANKMAGFAAGLVIGGVNIILLSFLLSIIVIVTGDTLSFLNRRTLRQSSILALTGVINPFLP